jgi:hypothetical protein
LGGRQDEPGFANLLNQRSPGVLDATARKDAVSADLDGPGGDLDRIVSCSATASASAALATSGVTGGWSTRSVKIGPCFATPVSAS